MNPERRWTDDPDITRYAELSGAELSDVTGDKLKKSDFPQSPVIATCNLAEDRFIRVRVLAHQSGVESDL
jgi:hypothetical protein